MRKCIDSLNYLLKAKAQLIWVNTYEENAFINDMCEYAAVEYPDYELHTWTNEGILDTYDTTTKEIISTATVSPQNIIPKIIQDENETDKNAVKHMYILKDIHALLDNAVFKRQLRTAKEYKSSTYTPVIILSPVTNIPIELEKLVTVFNYELPNYEEILSVVNQLITNFSNYNKRTNTEKYIIPSEDDIKAITNSLLGLTINEIIFLLNKSVAQYQRIDVNTISENKINLIQKTGLLDYVIPAVDFSDIGGNDTFKQWITDIEYTFSDEAKDFGCESPKGYLSLGIAGTGKTIMAEAIAKKWGYPLLIFNVSKIYDKLVGESEKRIEKAFRIIKSCAPCVLLFDEAEKIFGGYGGSESDAGTSSRVFSSILRFLAENDNIFVIMTSNDVSRLPPELMRSGRLDSMWYFGFPTAEERKDIFKIHFAKAGHAITNEDILEKAIKETDRYTGAEIKNIVKQAIWETFKQYKETGNKEITAQNIQYAISKVAPVYKTSKEKILGLEAYAKERALYANSKNKENAISDDISELVDFDL